MELQWELLYKDTGAFPRLLQFSEINDERFSYGINENIQHCLYFFYPPLKESVPAEPVVRSNIRLDEAVISGRPAFILTLLNSGLNNLFSDLIVSLVLQTKQAGTQGEKARFISLCNEWFELFDPLTGQLSRPEIQGLFAEICFLRYLLDGYSSSFNESLEAWKGPYGKGHDFEFAVNLFEVKSYTEGKPVIHISSEYQLDYLSGQYLRLVVCEFGSGPENGVSLSKLVHETAAVLRTQTGTRMKLFWNALNKAGITATNIPEYDSYLFNLKAFRFFDCSKPDFPSIRRTSIDDSLRNIKYDLALAGLSSFEITERFSFL